jgi:heme-degrading monooxygenase HmoA
MTIWPPCVPRRILEEVDKEAGMYARVAAFENRDMSLADELIGTVRERVRSGDDLIDAKRFLMLIDRQGGTALGITFFDTEDAIRRAEPAFERIGDEIPETQRGTRTSVETYEVILEDLGGTAEAARVTTLEGSPEGLAEGIRFIQEKIVPEAADISGWRGIVALADRRTGRTKTITFWDSAESLRASEERANQLRAQAAEALDETITSIERYDVALSEVLAAART